MQASSLLKLEFVEKYQEVLTPLEFLVIDFYKHNRKMHDHDALRVYEALIKYTKAKSTNYPLPQIKLEGISLDLYQQQLAFLLSKEDSFSFQELMECVKTLEKSLKLWNREFGSQGYLNYISQFN